MKPYERDALPKPLPFILVAVLCIAPLMVSTQAENWGWRKVAIPTDAYLQSVDMVNSTDGWAVGSEGAIIRWDGAKWSNVASPTSCKLVCVDMVSSNEGWAVAQRTDGYQTNQSIIRWTGQAGTT